MLNNVPIYRHSTSNDFYHRGFRPSHKILYDSCHGTNRRHLLGYDKRRYKMASPRPDNVPLFVVQRCSPYVRSVTVAEHIPVDSYD